MELSGTTTISDLWTNNVTLAVTCSRCRHEGAPSGLVSLALYPVSLGIYMRTLGSNYTIAQLSERLCCSKCKRSGYVRLDAATR